MSYLELLCAVEAGQHYSDPPARGARGEAIPDDLRVMLAGLEHRVRALVPGLPKAAWSFVEYGDGSACLRIDYERDGRRVSLLVSAECFDDEGIERFDTFTTRPLRRFAGEKGA